MVEAASVQLDTRKLADGALDWRAFEQLPDGVVVCDARGAVEYANRAFGELLARPLASVQSVLLESIVAGEDMLPLVGFAAVFGAELGHECSLLFMTGQGERRRLLVNFKRVGARVFLTLRDSGSMQQELSETTRWAAEEQERADVLNAVKEGLVAHNEALRAAQTELERAHQKLKDEVLARERLENELRLAQKLESIGQLAAGIAHEINTPLQYVGDNLNFVVDSWAQFSGYREQLERWLAEHEPAQQRVNALESELGLQFLLEQLPQALASSQEGIKHVSGIVKAMKSFARADQGEMLASDLNQSIRDTLTVAQNEYKNAARVVTELAELPPVVCFPSKLNQVVLNLVINAAHAIADQQRAELGMIRVRSAQAGQLVEISIQDDGGGIPEAIRDKIFDQFFTTKAVGRGTGQGLAIARSIVVDVHGGTLTFQSEVGKGTTFLIRLPIDGASAAGAS